MQPFRHERRCLRLGMFLALLVSIGENVNAQDEHGQELKSSPNELHKSDVDRLKDLTIGVFAERNFKRLMDSRSITEKLKNIKLRDKIAKWNNRNGTVLVYTTDAKIANMSDCPLDLENFLITGPIISKGMNPKVPYYFNVTNAPLFPDMHVLLVVTYKHKSIHREIISLNTSCEKQTTTTLDRFVVYNNKLWNGKPGPGRPKGKSYLPEIHVYLSLGTGNSTRVEHCLNMRCKRFELQYDFPPKPYNIYLDLHVIPRRKDEQNEFFKGDDDFTLMECSSKDGVPKVRDFNLQLLNNATYNVLRNFGKSMAKLSKIGEGLYHCQATSEAYGKQTIVNAAQALLVDANKHQKFVKFDTKKYKRSLEKEEEEKDDKEKEELKLARVEEDEHDHEGHDPSIVINGACRAELMLGLVVCSALVLTMERIL